MNDDELNAGQRHRAQLLNLGSRLKERMAELMPGLDVSAVPSSLPPTPYRAIVIPPGVRPVATGQFGTAIRATLPRFDFPSATEATLTAILCDLPGYLNRWWRHYVVSMIHLRPIEGTPPAHVEGSATHELVVIALDPERPPDPTDHRTWRWASVGTIQRALNRDRAPANHVHFEYAAFSATRAQCQLDLAGDDAAATRLADAVAAALCSGALTPERDDFPGGLAGWRAAVQEMARGNGGGQ